VTLNGKLADPPDDGAEPDRRFVELECGGVGWGVVVPFRTFDNTEPRNHARMVCRNHIALIICFEFVATQCELCK
jgi:hypothetical protein